jgi:hypothetical protein
VGGDGVGLGHRRKEEAKIAAEKIAGVRRSVDDGNGGRTHRTIFPLARPSFLPLL